MAIYEKILEQVVAERLTLYCNVDFVIEANQPGFHINVCDSWLIHKSEQCTLIIFFLRFQYNDRDQDFCSAFTSCKNRYCALELYCVIIRILKHMKNL